jgi:hypothetical protein
MVDVFLKEFIKKNGVEVEQLLNNYSQWLEKMGYLDSDWWSEEPQTVLAYLEERQLK